MERIKWVDVAKGWGIVLVVYGHIASDFLTTWLYTFHVPLFFFLSGYFFNPDKKPSVFLKSKAKGLLLPYVTLGLPIFLINAYYGFGPLQLLKLYSVQCRASTLWFLAALFMQFLLAYAVYHWISSRWTRWILVAVLTLIGVLLWRLGLLTLPWNLDVSLVTLPFFCLGHELRKNTIFQSLFVGKRILSYAAIFLLANIAGAIIMYQLQHHTIDLFSSHFEPEPLAYCTALAGIMALCLFSSKWYFRTISYIGKNSIVYFVWQQDIAIMIVTKVMSYFHLFETSTGLMLFVRNVVVLIASLLILTILNELIIKTKLRILIGK